MVQKHPKKLGITGPSRSEFSAKKRSSELLRLAIKLINLNIQLISKGKLRKEGLLVGKLFGWDRGLDYEKVYKQILNHYRDASRATSKAYDIVLLSQLRNGARVGEAITFIKKVAESRERELYVPVEKRKDGYERLMVLPKEIKLRDVLSLSYIIDQITVEKVATYCKYTYGFNTHSLRYAFISYMARKGTAPQLIAKMTGHKGLDFILYYTQQIEAENLLKEIK